MKKRLDGGGGGGRRGWGFQFKLEESCVEMSFNGNLQSLHLKTMAGNKEKEES